jgi:hypothetical protein
MAKGMAFAVALASSVHAQTIIHVNADSQDVGRGTEWDHAYRWQQAALPMTVAGGEIRVAVRICRLDESTVNPTGTHNREAKFQLVGGLATDEGCADHGAPELNERVTALFVTILSGDQIDSDADLSDISQFQSAFTDGYEIKSGSARHQIAVSRANHRQKAGALGE